MRSSNHWQIHNMHGPTVYKGDNPAEGLRQLIYLNKTNGGLYRLEFEGTMIIVESPLDKRL